jgi:outer membrane protein assembly factor BamD
MSRYFRNFFLLFAVGATLTACGGTANKQQEVENQSAEYLFEQATNALQEKKYKTATSYYNEVERQHPYSALATRAQIMAAYASYEDERYDDAIIALNRFIELHPGNDKIDYAYYLKAMSYYDQITDVRRDQELTQMALDELNVLISRFPESDYTREAMLKRDLVYDHLAGKEMEIGRYYLNRGHINAAVNRFRAVIQSYQTTTHTTEALYRLVEAYTILGVEPEARRIAGVLGHNYPGSKWYERAYELLDADSRQKLVEDRGLIDKTVDSIFKPE